MKQRISSIGKRHHPQKIQGPPGTSAPFRFAGAATTFKPCGLLEQLLCGEQHRGCAEQATASV